MAISLAFENEQIRQACESSRSAKRRFGAEVAAELQARLADLKAIDAVSEVIAMGFAKIDPSEDTRLVIPLSSEYVLRVAAHHRPEPRQWRNRVRLLRALVWLKEDRSVQDIALALGYGTPSAFITMFRKQVGFSPERYRRQMCGEDARPAA